MYLTIPEIKRHHHEFVLFTIDIEEKNAQTVEDFDEQKRTIGRNGVGSTRRSELKCVPLVIEAARPTQAFEAST